MSESYREQHPLLYEDLSEEEQLSPRYQGRFRPMVFKGRARNSVKGAAAIIKFWPEHWSSSITYWWIGLGMIGLITIIIYNSVICFTMMPPAHLNKETKMHTADTVHPVSIDTGSLFNVYMHLFVENNQEIDLNDYMPYIDIVANKYIDFKFHVLIVLNDTSTEANIMSADENNEMAFNLLWAKNNVHYSNLPNVIIEHVNLSEYMNNSPLRQHWKKLPKHFLQFLTRAVSIWDRGGIAFNPSILTPRSPHAAYIEKVQNILKNYHGTSKINVVQRKINKKPHNGKKKRVNNIRDIIDALEQEEEEELDNVVPDSPLKERRHSVREFNNKHEPLHASFYSPINETGTHQNIHPKFSNAIKNTTNINFKHPYFEETLQMAESKTNNVSPQMHVSNDTSSVGILPMLLEFLFKNKINVDSSTDEQTTNTRKRKHVLPEPKLNKNNLELSAESSDKKANKKMRPVVSKLVHDSEKIIEVNTVNSYDNNQLSIDLKGNIVFSGTPCHAFLGTMFSNSVHHNQESLTDFIISELSIFCKGALSSCKGIDVILI